MTQSPNEASKNKEWMALVSDHQKPSAKRASWQLVNTLGSYIVLWVLMYFSLSVSWWLTIPLAIIAGGLVIRNFIIFHDCGHGSFFKSRRANDFWGYITGAVSFTPYSRWRREHSIHHASSGDLERRGIGDIWTLTVQEYVESTRWKKFGYRLARNPFVLFGLAPLFLFLVRERIPLPNPKPGENRAVWVLNVYLLAQSVALIALFGFLPFLIIQLTTLLVAGSVGIWLFYVQHQFEDAYWEKGEDWDFATAAIKGSSFYKLPKVLQWFTGNIGFHHIHHLSPKIPNYNLEACHHSHAMFQDVEPLGIIASFKTATYQLWDEKSQKLITFAQLRAQQCAAATAG